jgi:Ca2+/Na+ antiporter
MICLLSCMRTYLLEIISLIHIVAMSTTKPEYMATTEAAKENDIVIVTVTVTFSWQTIRCIMLGPNILMWGFTISESYLQLDIYYLKIFILQRMQLICWPSQTLVTSSSMTWTCYMFISVKEDKYLPNC